MPLVTIGDFSGYAARTTLVCHARSLVPANSKESRTMAIRFHCDKCSYQIVLDSPAHNGVTCPSCQVTLVPLAEASAVQVPPLPPLPVQTAPNPPPAMAPMPR